MISQKSDSPIPPVERAELIAEPPIPAGLKNLHSWNWGLRHAVSQQERISYFSAASRLPKDRTVSSTLK